MPRGILPHFTWKEAWGEKKNAKKIYCAASAFHYFKCFRDTRRMAFQLRKVWLWSAACSGSMTGRKEGIRDWEEERRNSVDRARICIHSGGLQGPTVCTGSLSSSWKCWIFTLCLPSMWPHPLQTHAVNPHLYMHIYMQMPQQPWTPQSDDQLSPPLMSISGRGCTPHQGPERSAPARHHLPSPFIPCRVWVRTSKYIPLKLAFRVCVCVCVFSTAYVCAHTCNCLLISKQLGWCLFEMLLSANWLDKRGRKYKQESEEGRGGGGWRVGGGWSTCI